MKRTKRKHITPGKRKGIKGVVVSNKMKDTITVSVQRYIMLPKIRKYVRVHKKYLAHAPKNILNVGDAVVIQSCRPISKRKRYIISS